MPCGVRTGGLEDFDTFEKLYAAVLDQLRPVISQFAVQKYLNYKIAGENAPYLHLSLLLEDCVARGKAVFEGGRAVPERLQRDVWHHQLRGQPDRHSVPGV